MFKYLLTILILLFSCKSNQNFGILTVENKEMKYFLTHVEKANINSFDDINEHYFLKTFKVIFNRKVLINDEESIHKSFYYLLVGSYDEQAHINSKLFKSQEFILPEIDTVEDSEDGMEFIIHINALPNDLETLELDSVLIKDVRKPFIIRLSKF